MAGGATIYDLQGNATGFISAMQQASIQVNHFHQSTRNAAAGAKALETSTAGTARVSTTGARAMLELSRAAEDAVVSYGTNGLQGAVRGSLNNITALAAMLGPTGGAIAGFAAAGSAALLPFFQSFADGAAKAREETKKLEEEMIKAAGRSAKFTAEIENSSLSAIDSRLKGLGPNRASAAEELRIAELNVQKSMNLRKAVEEEIKSLLPAVGAGDEEATRDMLRARARGRELDAQIAERGGVRDEKRRVLEGIDANAALLRGRRDVLSNDEIFQRNSAEGARIARAAEQRLIADRASAFNRDVMLGSDIADRATRQMQSDNRFAQDVARRVQDGASTDQAIRDQLKETQEQTKILEGVKRAIEKLPPVKVIDF